MSADIRVESFPADKQPQALELLTKIKTATGQELLTALADLAKLKGLDISQGFDIKTFAEQFFTTLTPEQLTEKINAAMVDKTVEFKDIPDEALAASGIATSREELAQILGMTPEQLADAKFADIKKQVETLQIQNYSNASQLKQTIADPLASPAEKMEAHRRLRELGYIGVRSAEAKINDLQAQIEDGDTVMVGGKPVPIDDLLNNSTMQHIISQALKDPEFMKQLEQTQPQLANYIKTNEQALKNLTQSLTPAIQTFNEIQAHNAGLAGPLPANIAAEWIPGFGTTRDKKITDVPPVISLMNSTTDPKLKQDIATALTTISTSYPELKSVIQGMTAEELQRLGFTTNPNQFIENYRTYLTDKQAIAAKSGDDIFDFIFGGSASAEMFKNLRDNHGNSPAFKALLSEYADILDANRDGVVDSPDEIKNRLLAAGSLQNLIKSAGSGQNPFPKIGNIGSKLNQLQSQIKTQEENEKVIREATVYIDNIASKYPVGHNNTGKPQMKSRDYAKARDEIDNQLLQLKAKGLTNTPEYRRALGMKNYYAAMSSITAQYEAKPNQGWVADQITAMNYAMADGVENFSPEKLQELVPVVEHKGRLEKRISDLKNTLRDLSLPENTRKFYLKELQKAQEQHTQATKEIDGVLSKYRR